MTLSFHEVVFSAQEVLDLVDEADEAEPGSLAGFSDRFARAAEERSQQAPG